MTHMEELLNLPISQILRSDEDYVAMLQKRIARLNRWTLKYEEGSLRKQFSHCLTLTEECHQIAESLGASSRRFFNLYPSNENIEDWKVELLLRVAKRQKKMTTTTKEFSDIQEKAKHLMLTAVHTKQR